MNSNVKKFKKGFGILEVLVASVIIITVLSVLTLIGRSALANSKYVQQKTQAIYLAQEGIELVRQIRDTNWIDRNNTTQFNDTAWDSSNAKLVPATSGTIYYPFVSSIGGLNRWGLKNKVASTDTDVVINDSFVPNGSIQVYVREIKIDQITSASTILPDSGDNSIKNSRVEQSFKVTVTVKWTLNNQSKSISTSEIMTNWRPNF